jgi:hypothetical protein
MNPLLATALLGVGCSIASVRPTPFGTYRGTSLRGGDLDLQGAVLRTDRLLHACLTHATCQAR